jgi:hypothetical protein
MSNLSARLARLEEHPALARPARRIRIGHAEGPAEIPGAIVPGDGWHAWIMNTPSDGPEDPIEGMTQEQRDFLRPDDRVFAFVRWPVPGRDAIRDGVPEPDGQSWTELAGVMPAT